MGTKSPAVSAEMETGPGVLPSHALSFFPALLLTAALFCFKPQNEFDDFPISQELKRVRQERVSVQKRDFRWGCRCFPSK